MERSFTWAWQQQQQQLDDRLAAVTPFYWSRHRCDRSATGCWRPEKFGNNRRKPFNCPLESVPGSFRSSGSSAALPRPIRPFGGVALSTTIGSMEARPISAGRWILSTNSEFVFVRGGIFRVDGHSLWLPSARRTIERMREDTHRDWHDDNVEEGREEGFEEVEEERRREDVRSEREDGEAGTREEKWTESASRYCV